MALAMAAELDWWQEALKVEQHQRSSVSCLKKDDLLVKKSVFVLHDRMKVCEGREKKCRS